MQFNLWKIIKALAVVLVWTVATVEVQKEKCETRQVSVGLRLSGTSALCATLLQLSSPIRLLIGVNHQAPQVWVSAWLHCHTKNSPELHWPEGC